MKTHIFSQEIFHKERIPAGSSEEKNAQVLTTLTQGCGRSKF